MQVDYVQHWGTDLTVVNAARVSFDKKSDWVVAGFDEVWDADSRSVEIHKRLALSPKDEKLIRYLAEHKHTSCFEHIGATLKLKVPIFIARQIQRHRTFSYNEISRRYVDNPPEFFWPDKWRKRADNVKQGSSDEEIARMRVSHDDYDTTPQLVAESVANHALFAYNAMLKNDVAPELARALLPQNMYTEFYMTGNLRAWAHFLELRLDKHAQKEVQDVAKMVKEILDPLFPISMQALVNG